MLAFFSLFLCIILKCKANIEEINLEIHINERFKYFLKRSFFLRV